MNLITWNIQWCRGVDGRVDPARIVDHARAFADFDVLCLQEVAANFAELSGSRGENQFEMLAALLPGYLAIPAAGIDAPASDGGRRVFGNMILSRLPVMQIQRLQLPWPVDPQRKGMARVLIEATIDASFGPVRVMTTHLEYYSAVQRAAQVETLRERHQQACGHARSARVRDRSDGPFHTYEQTAHAILTGDFNYRPDDPLHARLQAEFEDGSPRLLDAWAQAHPGEPRAPTVGVYDRDQWPEPFCCDFIYLSASLHKRLRRVEVDASTQASDHQPMLLELDAD